MILITILIVIIVTFSLSEAEREIVSQLWSGPLEIESETEENLLPCMPPATIATIAITVTQCCRLHTDQCTTPQSNAMRGTRLGRDKICLYRKVFGA